jgi:hypothetical protein
VPYHLATAPYLYDFYSPLIVANLDHHVNDFCKKKCEKNDSDGNRTRVTAVKGRCLNRLTTEPKKPAAYSSSVNATADYVTISKKHLQELSLEIVS